MFLFLLLTFIVAWIFGLMDGAPRAFWSNDRDGQAESRALLAIGSQGWHTIPSLVVEWSRATGYWSAVPGDNQLAHGLGNPPWQCVDQAVNAAVLRLGVLTSWRAVTEHGLVT